MAFISIVLIGLMIALIILIGIPIIVILFSIIVSLLTVLFSSLCKKNNRNILLGLKTFIITCSSFLGAGFGFIIVTFVIPIIMNEVDINKYFMTYSIVFSTIGFALGLLFALVINKKVVDPLYALLQKHRQQKNSETK
jgi:hypothetical protein